MNDFRQPIDRDIYTIHTYYLTILVYRHGVGDNRLIVGSVILAGLCPHILIAGHRLLVPLLVQIRVVCKLLAPDYLSLPSVIVNHIILFATIGECARHKGGGNANNRGFVGQYLLGVLTNLERVGHVLLYPPMGLAGYDLNLVQLLPHNYLKLIKYILGLTQRFVVNRLAGIIEHQRKGGGKQY